MFTQGEWELTKDKRKIYSGEMCIAYLGVKGMSVPDTECIANANLISASPDLFKALEEVRLWLGKDMDSLEEDVINIVDNALAKARGEV